MATPEIPFLADEILEEIFVRLPHPQALGCAAIASPSFHRIVTKRSFLRCFRKLHPPPLLGFVTGGEGGFYPAQEPHHSASIARALVHAADFSYAFVPSPKPKNLFSRWFACDARDGRVLLESNRCFCRSILHTVFAVCDPLSRRYLVLPPLPVDLYQQSVQHKKLDNFQHRLASVGEDEEETSFRVIFWVNCSSKIVTFVFSSATGQWCVDASPSWSSLGIDDPSWRRVLHRFKYSSSCFYWTARYKDKVVVLDTRTMDFSTVNITSDHMQLINLPPQSRCTSSFVLPTEGALEMFTVVADCCPNGSSYLYHTTQENNNGSCHLKIVKLLPHGFCYSTEDANEGFLFLRGIRDQDRLDNNAPLHELFSLDVKTSQLKKVCGLARISRYFHSYFGLPPLLSKPSL